MRWERTLTSWIVRLMDCYRQPRTLSAALGRTEWRGDVLPCGSRRHSLPDKARTCGPYGGRSRSQSAALSLGPLVSLHPSNRPLITAHPWAIPHALHHAGTPRSHAVSCAERYLPPLRPHLRHQRGDQHPVPSLSSRGQHRASISTHKLELANVRGHRLRIVGFPTISTPASPSRPRPQRGRSPISLARHPPTAKR